MTDVALPGVLAEPAWASEVPRDPARSTPDRRPGSRRRTTNLDFDFGAALDRLADVRRTWDPPARLHVRGAARDLATRSDGRGDVVGAARVVAEVDERRHLVVLETDPRVQHGALLGASIGSGFRPLVDDVVGFAASGTPLWLLLTDLPIAGVISGYATLRTLAHAGVDPGTITPPVVLRKIADVCSGWQTGGIMNASVVAGRGVPIQDCPVAPDLGRADDPLAWHDLPALPVGAMRRRRRVDAFHVADGVEVDAVFRDSFVEPDGTEVVLHEYGLRARLVGDDLRVESIAAEPRVLPFPECPGATASLTQLVGVASRDLRGAVRERLRGTVGCTHLSDLVSCLNDLEVVLR